jgi:hypothetical protein
MKKLSASILSLALLFFGALFFASPAQAGDPDPKIDICHANNGSKGFVPLNVNISSIVNLKTGDPEGHGLDTTDVIPAFDWVHEKVRYYFPGSNLVSKGYILSTGCKEDAVPRTVTANAPIYTPPSCVLTDWKNNPYGTVELPENLGDRVQGVSFGPSLNTDNPDAAFFYTEYALKAADEDFTYSWAEGQTGKFTQQATHISSDPLWVVDSKTGIGGCETANTGAGPGTTMLMYAGGGIAVLGLLFFLLPKLTRRNS